MATKRDKAILALQKEIEKKKEALGKLSKFKPITNLVLPMNNTRVNLNVLDKDALLFTIAQLVSVQTNLVAVGITDTPELGGYSIEDWIHDLKGKYDMKNRSAEEAKLNSLQNQLGDLLSDDLKKDNALESIAKQLKG